MPEMRSMDVRATFLDGRVLVGEICDWDMRRGTFRLSLNVDFHTPAERESEMDEHHCVRDAASIVQEEVALDRRGNALVPRRVNRMDHRVEGLRQHHQYRAKLQEILDQHYGTGTGRVFVEQIDDLRRGDFLKIRRPCLECGAINCRPSAHDGPVAPPASAPMPMTPEHVAEVMRALEEDMSRSVFSALTSASRVPYDDSTPVVPAGTAVRSGIVPGEYRWTMPIEFTSQEWRIATVEGVTGVTVTPPTDEAEDERPAIQGITITGTVEV